MSILLGRWVLTALVAMLAGALLFWLHVSERVAGLEAFNVWVVSGLPLLVWVLAFATRAYVYGGALNHWHFLATEAQAVQQAWEYWAHRYLAVQGSCVLLPDQVSAAVLARNSNVPSRVGKARRITALPEREREHAGLRLLLSAVAPAVRTVSAKQRLQVTLLSDVEPDRYESLRDTWQRVWVNDFELPTPAAVSLCGNLSYQWIDETLKAARSTTELILILQIHGGVAYSDGLAALLLRPDRLALSGEQPVAGGLSRPMPLDIANLSGDLRIFLQSQTNARLATGVLADCADWRPYMRSVLSLSGAEQLSLKADQQWTQECLCGLPGPLSHWLTAALGVEMARHQQRPLLMLTQENSGHWISTVTTGEAA